MPVQRIAHHPVSRGQRSSVKQGQAMLVTHPPSGLTGVGPSLFRWYARPVQAKPAFSAPQFVAESPAPVHKETVAGRRVETLDSDLLLGHQLVV